MLRVLQVYSGEKNHDTMIDANGGTLPLKAKPGGTVLLFLASVRPNVRIEDDTCCSSSEYHLVAA